MDRARFESIQKERAMWRKTITLNDELVKKLNEEIAKLKKEVTRIEAESEKIKEINKDDN
jgi:hypothetical protein